MSTTSITSYAPSGWGNLIATASHESGGAIVRLAWENIAALGGIKKEFCNNPDHGRLMQSSWTNNTADSEAYNPTEGGSVWDGDLMDSVGSSCLKRIWKPAANTLKTECQMAFFRDVDGLRVSPFLFEKQVTLGVNGIWNAIEVITTIKTPKDKVFPMHQFEHLTLYMPPEFNIFETLNRATKTLSPLSSTPGEQPLPIVASTSDAKWATGIFTPAGNPGGGYGRWNFGDCTKWNAVTRDYNLPAGAVLTRRNIVAVGSRDDVRNTLSLPW